VTGQWFMWRFCIPSGPAADLYLVWEILFHISSAEMGGNISASDIGGSGSPR
jgi:hypothetical protein